LFYHMVKLYFICLVSCGVDFHGKIGSALGSDTGPYGNETQLVKAGCCSNLNGQVELVIQGRMLTQGGVGALECHTAVLISC